ncbi:acetate uptake transporter [Actinomadura roseirufa]|uniref:acetate uptake transporter n=1 Tax=Actinomadura roseirufa TaxID=2094049 RepID=UPI001041B478|nr:acetate uptake transporter family protein [Actinomadura roseirufa]
MADVEAGRLAAPAPSAAPAAGIADPGPLGLAAFALTTFVLSCVNAGILEAGTKTVVLGLALFYGGLAQFAAGMWEFRKDNTFGALAFTSYGAFWLSFAGILFFYKPAGATPDQAAHAVGVFLLGWTIFTAYMTIAALRVSGAVAAVFVFLTVTFVFLAIGDLTVNADVTKIGGYLGLVTAVLAWYTSFATVTNSTWKRTLLPTWPVR